MEKLRTSQNFTELVHLLEVFDCFLIEKCSYLALQPVLQLDRKVLAASEERFWVFTKKVDLASKLKAQMT